MTITKSYNKHTNTWYVYDTTYVFDETKNKKVQKRKCIGKYDPVTDSIIETGSRGRPQKVLEPNRVSNSKSINSSALDIDSALKRIASIEKVIAELQSEVTELKDFLLNNQNSSV
ncbi:MAG: hypothetical protein SPK70_05285 [Succinivibrio dextrinosolvens]|nr:hypothetical protein [Succinivibrio dextrinosolvens]MDY6470463.1 hypothetical protein [Succinivibrio dextrinosolvens]